MKYFEKVQCEMYVRLTKNLKSMPEKEGKLFLEKIELSDNSPIGQMAIIPRHFFKIP